MWSFIKQLVKCITDDRIDTLLLKKWAVQGTPVTRAVALTILDRTTGGKLLKSLKRELKRINNDNL